MCEHRLFPATSRAGLLSQMTRGIVQELVDFKGSLVTRFQPFNVDLYVCCLRPVTVDDALATGTLARLIAVLCKHLHTITKRVIKMIEGDVRDGVVHSGTRTTEKKGRPSECSRAVLYVTLTERKENFKKKRPVNVRQKRSANVIH